MADQLYDRGIKGYKYESIQIDYLVSTPNMSVCPNCGPVKALRVRKYTPDFELPNGIFIECKGRLTATDRAKHKAIRKQHPELPLRMLFLADNVIKESAKKLRYTDWAKSIGLPCAVKEIPEEWLRKRGKKSMLPDAS